MKASPKKYAATNANLDDHALAPAMRFLIAVALDGDTMTYGALKQRLEDDADFSTIFATRIGHVAGTLMNAIQAIDKTAPLINVLVVSQRDGMPSRGAGSYMATRHGQPRLAQENAKSRFHKLWKNCFNRSAAEVYAYAAEDWSALYQQVFGQPLTHQQIEIEREIRKQGNEEDDQVGSGKYGKGGEGPFHKALRLWVTKNPEAISQRFRNARAETEDELFSGDRVDAVYYSGLKTVVLEVKSRISNEVDLRRGVFQCIKYRAVKQAMDVRHDAVVEAYLVTEQPLSGDVTALLKRHDIRHFQAPKERS
ncbi:hypothetical protein [Sphingomonas sp. RB1R13]|uniref:hypothetical protein n=1 Tax=Sphingomonas sp. RB1R13 TaxID=3096159 RepID=UPI002FC7957B